MKKYRYNNNLVVELSTNFVIKKCKDKNSAKDLTLKLNKGSGFQGETPKFFVYAKDQI